MLEIIDSNYTRNRYGVTHFAELHRTLHKNFLIWRCQNDMPPFSTPVIQIRRLISLPGFRSDTELRSL